MDDATPNNVIAFPGVKKSIPKSEMSSVQEIYDNIQGIKESEIIEMTEALGTMIVETMAIAGFRVSATDDNAPVLCFFIESLKALVSQHYGIDHPFHVMAHNCFVQNEDGNIVFREPKFKFTDTTISNDELDSLTDGEEQ